MNIGLDGWIEGVARQPAADHGGPIEPKLIVMHYTGAGPHLGSVEWLAEADGVYVSAHIVIGRQGQIMQLVPFTTKAYHAGESKWWGIRGVNSFSIGIELANFGLLAKSAGGGYVSRTITPVVVDDINVVFAAHNATPTKVEAWERYLEAQIKKAEEVCAALVDTYDISEIVGHDDVAPKRKIDPGPAFPMAAFHSKIFGLNGVTNA
jgi:N-acetylmuramoyl-L-alanine amidase